MVSHCDYDMMMENCYNNDSGLNLATTFDQCSDHNHHDSSFLVPSQTLPYYSWPVPIEVASEGRAASASKSHSQAEKRRRDRINAQLASLRKLIPKSDKMDKAALLGSVIDHVKDLKRKAMDVSRANITVPTETDEVTIEYDHVQYESFTKSNNANNKFKDSNNSNSFVIKASVCCDDRPELFSELIKVLKGLRLTAIKADIASVGGRIKSIFLLCSKGNDDDDEDGSVCLSTLKHSLKSVVTKIASSSMASTCPTRSKRQRFFLPSHCI